jgi:hypothetical protein
MTPLETQLRALREAEARVTPPSHVEGAVLDAWDAAHSTRHGRRPFGRVWHSLAPAAAGVALVFTLALLGGRLRGLGATPVEDSLATLFLVGEPILQGEPVRVVRMRVPASTLTTLGVRSLAGEFAQDVDVDVIVGEDGVARAIRVGM